MRRTIHLASVGTVAQRTSLSRSARGPRAWVTVAVVTSTLSACDGGADSGSLEVFPDAGGAADADLAGRGDLVHAGRLDDRIAFVVDPEPVYHVGWSDGDHPFGLIGGAALLGGGRAVVGDFITGSLVLLGPDGTPVAQWGSAGEGPGEFGRVNSLARAGPESVVVYDSRLRRFTLLENGETRSTVTWALAATFPYLSVIGFDAARNRALMVPASYPTGFTEPWYRVPILGTDLAGGAVDTVRVIDFVMRQPPEGGRDPYGRRSAVGISAGALILARNDRPDVEILNLEGRTVRVIRWDEEPRAFTDSIFEAFERAYLEGLDPNPDPTRAAQRTELLAGWRAGRLPTLPYTRALRGDDQGNVWIGEFPLRSDREERYRVFSAEGEWLGWVEMPPRTEVMDIYEGHLLARHFSPLGVEALALYRLR
jgi:hypothetical protein